MNLREHETDMQSISGRPCARQAFSVTCNDKSPISSSRFAKNVVPNLPIRGDVLPVSGAEKARSASSGAAAAAADAAPGGAAAGLVYSQTSGTSSGTVIRVDREASRLKRLRCSVLTAARLHVQQKSRWRVCMLTLTYADPRGWRPDQMSTLVRHIRQWLKRKGLSMRYVWVQEFCKKDARPHYHMLIWLPYGLNLPKPDEQGWWQEGWTRIEWAKNAVGYIAKYASKADSLAQPVKGARMHGNGGLTDEALIEQRWWKLPSWLRDGVKPSDRVRRAPTGSGGGFLHPETGEVYRSPWVVFFRGGQVYIERRDSAPVK